MNTLVFLKFIGTLALPPASLLLGIVIAGIFRLLGFRRFGKFVFAVSIVQFLLLCTSLVSDALIWPLQRQAIAEARKAKPCCYDAIVVLGGAIAPPEGSYSPNPSVTPASNRLWQAARLYKAGAAPHIIVSGGDFNKTEASDTSEAKYMRVFLMDLGVPSQAILEEGAARNTIENIVNVRAMVKGGPVALITTAYHMPRSLRLARRYGLDASAFPVEFHSQSGGAPWSVFLPSASAMMSSSAALWEYMALIFDRRGPAPTP